MSTNVQKKELKKLLEPVENMLGKPFSDASLKKSHRSVLISFEQMLQYIDNVIENVDQANNEKRKKKEEPTINEHIKGLLVTFREMAPNFYTQFEFSLLDEIKKQNDLHAQLSAVIEKIDNGSANDLAREVIIQKRDFSKSEYDYLKQKYPTLMQNALDKIRDEWQRIDAIAVASQALARDETLIRSLEAVVEIAALSVGIYDERIVVVPGRQFALNFFSYQDNFAVLTVPIYSVRSRWEWSIFWHELAGRQVRLLEKGTKQLETNLKEVFKNYKDRSTAGKYDFGENKSGAAYLKALFRENELDLVDLGGFEYQFERILANLPEENKFDIYEHMKTRGWCVEWFQELFEDSYSVLTFGSDFLVYFENILSRHNIVDGRHPPKEIRMGMAKALLALADEDLLDEKESKSILVGDQPGLSENDKEVIGIVAKQITKFSSLVSMSNANKILLNWEKGAPSGNQDSPYIQQNAVLGEILMWFAVDKYYKEVVDNIKSSISNWTTVIPAHGELDDGGLPLDAEIDELLKGIENKKSPEASFKQLLDKRNYKQLLDLPFYERDFFNSDGITNVIYRKNGNDIPQNFDMQKSNAVFTPGFDCTLVGTQTLIREVRFNAGGSTYTLDLITWNNKFPPGSSFIIS